jgi:hypothetical protein
MSVILRSLRPTVHRSTDRSRHRGAGAWRAMAAVVAGAVVGVAMSGLLASRATAQIPMVTPAKAAATKAAEASNAQTAGMQDAGNATSPSNAAQQSTMTTSMPPVRTTTMTPITASGGQGPQQKRPLKTMASTTQAGIPVKPVLSLGSTPSHTSVTVTSTTTAATRNTAAAGKTITPTATAAAGPPGDSGAKSISVTQRGTKGEVSLNREVYSYDPGGRRDPFVSLMRSGELRPMLSDLRLVTVLYDPTGRNSIAVMHDLSTKDQYRVRVGQTLGRMRVAQIQPKQVVFTVEEVGFSRQEALALGDTTKARMQ